MKSTKSSILNIMPSIILIIILVTAAYINVIPAKGNERNDAEYVVSGSVTRVASDWDAPKKLIHTYVTLAVEKSTKGVVKERQITIKVLGGSVGDLSLWAENQPEFMVGEKIEVDLEKDGSYYRVVGGENGKRSLSGSPLIPAVGQRFYKYKGLHWMSMPVRYYINSLGTADTANEFTSIQYSFQAWENDQSSYVDFSYMGTTTRKGGYDGYNVVYWDTFGAGAIAVALIWYIGNQIVEADMVLNDYYSWATTGVAGTMDVQNIATHEAGHWLLLEDLYYSADSAETMYGYGALGETKKRSLNVGDIAGVRYIYPTRRTVSPGKWFGYETQGADVALADVNRNGKLDMVFVWVDNPIGANSIVYRVGWDITSNGAVSSWSSEIHAPVSPGWETQGIGASLYDIDGNGVLDMIVCWADNPAKDNRLYYEIGWNLNTAGYAASWTGWKNYTTNAPIGWETQGVGLAVGNINENPRPEFIVLYVDNPTGPNRMFYRIGWDLDTSGNTNSWHGSRLVADGGWVGDNTAEAGLALADVNTDGMKDLVVFWLDDPAAGNIGHYIVGFNIDNTGDVEYWTTPEHMPGDPIGSLTPGGGVASADLNNNGIPDLVFAWVDNPTLDNKGYYILEMETRIASHP